MYSKIILLLPFRPQIHGKKRDIDKVNIKIPKDQTAPRALKIETPL